MKYCFYCGKQVSQNAEECPHCFENISNSEENKKYHAFVECIKCGSNNVEYNLIKKNKGGIVYEEQVYTCNECGKQFRDRNRLGKSFNNTPQIILGDNLKAIIKWIIIIGIIIYFMVKCDIFGKIASSVPTAYDYIQDCNGLQTVQLVDIYKEYQENENTATEKYIGKAFIFEGKIFRIDSDKTMLQIDSDYISPEIYVNKNEQTKLDKYNSGDTIRVCGIVKSKKTLVSVPIFVENATIIDN